MESASLIKTHCGSHLDSTEKQAPSRVLRAVAAGTEFAHAEQAAFPEVLQSPQACGSPALEGVFVRINSGNAVYRMPVLEIHKALRHSKDSKVSRTQETWLTSYNLAFPNLLVQGAIVWGGF